MAPEKDNTVSGAEKREADGEQAPSTTTTKKQKQDKPTTEPTRRSSRQVSAPKKFEEAPKPQQTKKKSTKSTTASKSKSTSTKGAAKDKDANGKNGDDKKTFGSSHGPVDPPQGTSQASSSRLPEKGEEVHWKAMPGWVKGEVIEIVKENKTIDGKSIKASEQDPRIALKSHGPSGKTAVHKPEAIYF